MSMHSARDFFELQESRVKLAVLFNPRLNDLSAAVRSSSQPGAAKVARIWKLVVRREIVPLDDPAFLSAVHSEVTISFSFGGTAETWRTGLQTFNKGNVPPSFHGLFEKYLLPETLSVGVALPRSAILIEMGSGGGRGADSSGRASDCEDV